MSSVMSRVLQAIIIVVVAVVLVLVLSFVIIVIIGFLQGGWNLTSASHLAGPNCGGIMAGCH